MHLHMSFKVTSLESEHLTPQSVHVPTAPGFLQSVLYNAAQNLWSGSALGPDALHTDEDR